MDAIIFAVPHEEFKTIKLEDIKKLYNQRWNGYSNAIDEVAATSEIEREKPKYVLIDVKGIFNKKKQKI